MNEFEGTPIRSATSDANAGIVDRPAMRHETRQVVQTDVKNTQAADYNSAKFGNALGNALQSRLTAETNNTKERMANEAAIRQGSNAAINSIDAEKKRSGWEKGIFGENVEYRAAQQRAATNAVNATYLEQATTIDKYSGESPEMYKGRLNATLDTMLEPYGKDAETKAIVASAWNTASAKLANKQYESHYAYNQLQQRQTYDTQVAQTFDTFTVEASLASSPEEQGHLVKEAQAFFKGSTKPPQMTESAWRESVNMNLSNALRKGNIGAYNAAKSTGWLESLTDAERIKLDEAISVYDTDFTQRAQLVYEEAELAALDAKTLDDAKAIYKTARGNIDALTARLSGTDRGNLALARVQQQAQRGVLSTQQAIEEADKKLKATSLKAAEKALEAQAAEERHNNLKWSTRMEDPIERAGFVSELDPKQSELEDALDDSIVDDITRLTGADGKMSMTEATQVLFKDVKSASVVAKRVNAQQVTSPLVKSAVEGFVGSFTGMATESGVLSPEGHVVLQSIAQFEKNPANFKTTVGTVTYDNLQIVKTGLARGKTVEMVQKEVNNFNENKGKADVQGRDWELGKNQTKREKITELVEEWTDQRPYGDTLTRYMEEFGRALQIYGGDTKLAKDYLRTSVMADSVTYRGIKVDNGNNLNKVTDRNFKTLMDGAQKFSGNNASLLTPFLAALTGATEDSQGKTLTNIEQISGLKLYTDSARGGFFIDSFDAQQPVYVSETQMKQWNQVLEERENFQKLRDKKERGTVLSKWGAQEMSAPLSNLN